MLKLCKQHIICNDLPLTYPEKVYNRAKPETSMQTILSALALLVIILVLLLKDRLYGWDGSGESKITTPA